MSSILNEICNYKKDFVNEKSKELSIKEIIKKIDLFDPKRDFKKIIDTNFVNNKISVIAEIKKASPSKGIISNNFKPVSIAKSYEEGGATCISVLTDEKYFLGSMEDLTEVRRNCSLPLIRKDFIISEYQIFESKYIGADCILLIHSVLTKNEILNFCKLAKELKLDVLIEVHNKEELMNVCSINDILIGINNRNLNTMKVDLQNSINLKSYFSSNLNFICESGIKTIEDIKKLLSFDFKTFLIGEQLMKSKNPKNELQNIFKLGRK